MLRPISALLLLSSILAGLSLAAPIHPALTAGSPVPGFHAAVHGETQVVFALAAGPDGKIIIGGDFSSVGDLPAGRLARLNPDGSPDSAFLLGSGANGPVRAVVLQPDGKILVGGAFTAVSSAPRPYLARLNPNGSLDPSFAAGPGPDFTVYTLAALTDGKVLIGGEFFTYNQVVQPYLAQLTSASTLDPAFRPVLNGPVQSLAVQPDGKILIAGGFTTVNGQPCGRIARLNRDGSLDPTFDPSPGADGYVWTTALQADGMILIGGDFSAVGGQSRLRLARLNTDGSPDPTFDSGSGADSWVYALLPLPDGRIMIGGAFHSLGGRSGPGLARLNPDGSPDAGFSPGPAGYDSIFGLVRLPGGDLLAGGSFQPAQAGRSGAVARLSILQEPGRLPAFTSSLIAR